MGRKSRSRRKKEREALAAAQGLAPGGDVVDKPEAPEAESPVEPEPVSAAEHVSASSPAPSPEPIPEPTPEPTPAPAAEPTPERTPEPKVEPPSPVIETQVTAPPPEQKSWRPSFDAESIPAAFAAFLPWFFRTLRSAGKNLPSWREIFAWLRELFFGADPECHSATGPARPAMRLLAALYDASLLFLLNTLIFGLAGYRAISRFMEPLVENNPDAFVPAEAKNYFLAALCAAAVLNWLYLTLPETLTNSGTIGKKLCSLRAAALDGSRLTFFRANLRLIAKLAVFGTFGLGFILSVTRKDRRALHDLMAKTQVVRNPEMESAPEPRA